VKKKISIILVFLMAIAMLTLLVSPAIAAKPTTMTLIGYVVVIGAGTGTDFPAGKSDTYQIKFRDVPFVMMGQIMAGDSITYLTPGGYYHANEMVKASGDRTWTGTWTMESATVAGIGSGSLKIGSSWNDAETPATWWITGATGDLRGLKGSGTVTPVPGFEYAYMFVFEVQIP
jgi:hypothetical protein